MTSRPALPCRALLALVLGVCGASAWVGVAPSAAADQLCARDTACIVVRLLGDDGDATHVVTGGDLGRWQDVDKDDDYRLRYRPGGATSSAELPDTRVSVNALIRRLGTEVGGSFAGLSPDGVTYIRVQKPGGGSTTLRARDLGASGSSDFADGLVPTFSLTRTGSEAGSGQPGYLRPLRASTDDVNSGDFVISANAPLQLSISTDGRPLDVSATATPQPAFVMRSVAFSASVEDPPAGAAYSWSFGDGATGTGVAPEHTYGTPGTYRVTVDVRAAGSTGQTQLDLVVKDPGLEPTIFAGDGEAERTVGQSTTFRVRFANTAAMPDSYAWQVDGATFDTGAGARRTWEKKGSFKVQLLTTLNGKVEYSNVITVAVDQEETEGSDGPPTTGPVTDDTTTTGPVTDDTTTTGSSTDDDAPVTGPDQGDGNAVGGSATPVPGGTGVKTPPGGLTGILLTGASTPAEVVPLPGSSATDDAQQQAAPAARARTEPGGAGGGTVRWGLGILPLLLFLGVAREAGWVRRLRTTSARRP